MAINKKSLVSKSPAAKTTPTKSAAVSPVAGAKMKPAMARLTTAKLKPTMARLQTTREVL